MAGAAGASTADRDRCRSATSRATSVTSAHSVRPGLDRRLEPLHEPGEVACARATRRSRSSAAVLLGRGALARASAPCPRITVTGVRSSWPSAETSSWRLAARSSSASCAISSCRVRRRSRSSASVSSSITVGVSCGRDDAASRSRPPGPRSGSRRRRSPSARSRRRPPPACRGPPAGPPSPVSATIPMLGVERLEPAGRLDPVHRGHPHVHQHHVGLGGRRTAPAPGRRCPPGRRPRSSSVSRSETRESRNPALSSTTSTRTRWRVVAGALCTNMSQVSRSRSPGASAYTCVSSTSPRWGTTYVGCGRYRRRTSLPSRPAATPLLCWPQICSPSAASHAAPERDPRSSRRRANRRPPGPGTPESRERGNASAGEGRIGCAMTRATQSAAARTDCGRARTTSTAAAPHVGATPTFCPTFAHVALPRTERRELTR